MIRSENILKRIQEIRVDATFGKKKHFNAADRKEYYNVYLGLPPVLINIILGSLLFGLLSDTLGHIAKWVGGIFAFIAATLGGIQTYYNFHQQIEGHRKVAQRYLKVAKECSNSEAYYYDNQINTDELRCRCDKLSDKISEINRDAICFPTSNIDYDKAKQGIGDGQEEYTERELSS